MTVNNENIFCFHTYFYTHITIIVCYNCCSLMN